MTFMPNCCHQLHYAGGCCHCNHSSSFKMPAKTSAEWALANPILDAGAPAYETDTGKWKLGNGTDRYTHLHYQNEPTTTLKTRVHAAPLKAIR
jgi:hypothetical protein